MDSARMCYTQRNSDDERGGVRYVKALSKAPIFDSAPAPCLWAAYGVLRGRVEAQWRACLHTLSRCVNLRCHLGDRADEPLGAQAHKPTTVTYSVVGHFTSPEEQNLVVACVPPPSLASVRPPPRLCCSLALGLCTCGRVVARSAGTPRLCLVRREEQARVLTTRSLCRLPAQEVHAHRDPPAHARRSAGAAPHLPVL